MARGVRSVLVAFVVVLTLTACDVRPKDVRWQDRFASFVDADRRSPPSPGKVLFVGSSSISGWDLAESFPGLDAINRGLPGATVGDVVRHADRTVRPYRPGIVVLYGGDNDLAKGAAPEEVVDAVLEVHALVRALDREAIVFALSVKPSPRRWSDRERVTRTNELLRRRADELAGLEYIDVASALLDADGRPHAEYFHPDGLHLSALGYGRWTEIVAPRIELALERRRGEMPADRHVRDAGR